MPCSCLFESNRRIGLTDNVGRVVRVAREGDRIYQSDVTVLWDGKRKRDLDTRLIYF